MSKVRTFSRVFPGNHPRKGEPTYFVEKFLNWYWNQERNPYHSVGDMIEDLNGVRMPEFVKQLNPEIKEWKNHTIRAGHHFKAGDRFSPRVWSGKPYNSKQIIIAPDIEVKKVWDFDIDLNCVYSINGKYTDELHDVLLATNDGLSEEDFQFWFMPNMNRPKEFSGQIICWNDKVEY